LASLRNLILNIKNTSFLGRERVGNVQCDCKHAVSGGRFVPASSAFIFQGCSRNARRQRTRSVPLQDQHLALAILLELAVQRGTLSQMLSAILLLLQLWDSGAQETDNERSHPGHQRPAFALAAKVPEHHLQEGYTPLRGRHARECV
uniref:Uncharacterized protein n=1 Tax=Macaca mulatta TaxID=9544 RepID=A0A5F8AQM5_MACMU